LFVWIFDSTYFVQGKTLHSDADLLFLAGLGRRSRSTKRHARVDLFEKSLSFGIQYYTCFITIHRLSRFYDCFVEILHVAQDEHVGEVRESEHELGGETEHDV